MCPRTRRRDDGAGASGRRGGRLLAASAGLALSLLSVIASADEPGGSSEPAPGVSVRIGSVRPGTSVAIESTLGEDDGTVGRVVSRCFDDCEEVLDPGPYRLRLIGADGETIGTKSVSLRRPMIFHVTEANPGAATTGLVLGITGAALAVTGLAALGALALSDPDDGSNSRQWVGIYALAAIPVGAIMTSIGWGLFAHNRRLFRGEVIKERKTHDDPDAVREAPNLRVGIAPGPQGVAGALTLSF
jgi:hypothetical protein